MSGIVPMMMKIEGLYVILVEFPRFVILHDRPKENHECYRMLQNVTECYRMLPNVTECYQTCYEMLRNVTRCYEMLPNVYACYKKYKYIGDTAWRQRELQ